MTTKPKPVGRPPLKAKKTHFPNSLVAKETSRLLKRWQRLLTAVEPSITRGRMLDRLVELSKERMEESIRLTLIAAGIAKPKPPEGGR